MKITQGLRSKYLQKLSKTCRKNQRRSYFILIEQKRKSIKIAAYGAAAKNTLFNYAGVKQDLLPFVFDAAESKQESFCLVATSQSFHEKMSEFEIDSILILPWNIKTEIMESIKAY